MIDLVKGDKAGDNFSVASTSAFILSTSDVNMPREDRAWKFARIRAMLEAKLFVGSYRSISPFTREISASFRVP